MPLDGLTLAAVADELRATCVNGRIQGVFLPAPLAVGLEIYGRGDTRYLFASAHAQHARLHLTDVKLSRGSEDVTPLLLLLRKYVRDGRLAAVEQTAVERTLALIITKADDVDKGLTTVTLVIEIMGRYSNIILVDESGVVMEAVKHVAADVNRFRVTLPRHPYAPPPLQNKADVRGLSADTLAHALAATDQPAWQVLVRTYAGVSPLLAREAVFRAAGASDALCNVVSPQTLASVLAGLLSPQHTHQWSPSMAREGENILEFAPYSLTQFGDQSLPAPSISAAIHAYYAQETVASDYAGLKQAAQKALDAQRQRVLRRRQSLQTQEAVGAQAEALRVKGEMLLAYASQVQHGQREMIVDMGEGEPPLKIALDARLTAVENAQEYFRRYTQARDAARSIPPLLEAVQLDLAYLDQLQLDLDMAKTAAEIREAQGSLGEASPQREDSGKNKSKKKGSPPKPGSKLPPLSYTSADGMEIVVGRNARQNDYVTFELASARDLWLHARGVAGSHVIVRSGGRPVSEKTLAYAAALAAAHSAARDSTSVAVSYTQRRNVHRARGGGPGMVTYGGERTIHVRPTEGKLDGLTRCTG